MHCGARRICLHMFTQHSFLEALVSRSAHFYKGSGLEMNCATATHNISYIRCSDRHALSMEGPARKRQEGEIEPLHVSMPRELKSRPSTSPTHPGRMLAATNLVLLSTDSDGRNSSQCCVKVWLPIEILAHSGCHLRSLWIGSCLPYSAFML